MKNKYIILFAFVFIGTLTVCFWSIFNSSYKLDDVDVDSDYEIIELKLGTMYSVGEQYLNKLQDPRYYFSSSDSKIVSIDEKTGAIFAKKVGEAIIYIMDSEDSSIIHAYKTLVYDDEMPRIKVQEIAVKKLSINKSKITLGIGAKEKLTIAISPDNASNKDVVWESSNPTIVKVSSSGEITGVSEGKATVTVKLKDGEKKAKCEVTVKMIAVEEIQLNKTSTAISMGGTEKIKATILPSNAGDKRVTWTSSNSDVVSVTEDGVIKGLNVGSATVIAKTIDGGKTASISVQVKEISVTEIKLYKTNTTINVGASEKIIATVTPSNVSSKEIAWSSSNTSIVTVSADGTVHGVKEGTATVTARTKNGGKTATITVKVVVPKVQVNNISLNKTTTTLNIAATEKLIATVSPNNASNKSVIWSSSDTSIVTVTADGTIKGIKEGTANIIVKTNDGGKTAKVTVTVKPISVTGISLNKSSLELKIGSTEKVTATILPNNATNKNLTWISSNTSVATVTADGTIKGIKEGTANITAKTNDGGKTAKVTVTVKQETVASISLNKTSETIYLNSNDATLTLRATILPSGAANKTVAWSSNNNSVATVSTNGVVTAKSPGLATITATVDGKTATCTINVKKKIIIIVGASQVGKMQQFIDQYHINGNNYYVSNDTLKIIAKAGSSFAYQTGEGYNIMKAFMNNYSALKQYIEFYIYLPVAGNGIASFTCSNITATNSTIIQYMENYNQKIQALKNLSYNLKAYVVSVQPVKPRQASSSTVVANTNSNSCTKGYKSNVKYYTFNKVIKRLSNNYSNLNYVETFTKIMQVNDTGAAYSYKIDYNTIDGVHWTEETTKKYVSLMLESNGNL